MTDLAFGDDVICTAPDGKRLRGTVIRVLSNGRVLVELGRQGVGHFLHDARLFDADKVERTRNE